MEFIAETSKVVNLLPPKDISAAAHSVTYVNMKNYDHVEFIVTMGATGAIGASKNVTLKEAKDTSGTSATNLPINAYYKNEAALGSSSIANDTYTRTTVASSGATFALTASTNNIVYTIPVDGQQLSESFDCVGVGVDTTSAAAICGVTAILSRGRYKSDNPPSAL